MAYIVRDDSGESADATQASFTHHYARLRGLVMHYVSAGSGFPVVLLHGWPQTWFEWRHVMARLAPRYRVIAPDLRGLGDSTRPLDGYDSQTLAGDLQELLSEHLGIAAYHPAGHDWGGPTAFALAAAQAEAFAYRPDDIGAEDLEEYRRTCTQPGALRAGF